MEKFRQNVGDILKMLMKNITFQECPLLLKKYQLSINRKVGRLQGFAGVVSESRPMTLIHGDGMYSLPIHFGVDNNNTNINNN